MYQRYLAIMGIFFKNQGTHTELISMGPKLARIRYLSDKTKCCPHIKVLPVMEHTDGYRRSISYPHRLQPDYSYCQGQE
jgi:hypothetical protein